MRHRRRPAAKKSHGALWSIIYIDLMTQIMAFFVIVWSVEHGTKLTQTKSLGTGVGIAKQVTPAVTIGNQRENLREQPGKASGTELERARNPRASQCR